MGRIFETRKTTMFARWDRMAKAFTRCGKEIAMAVKAAGPLPENNPALRRALQNARSVNMFVSTTRFAGTPGGRKCRSVIWQISIRRNLPVIVTRSLGMWRRRDNSPRPP